MSGRSSARVVLDLDRGSAKGICLVHQVCPGWKSLHAEHVRYISDAVQVNTEHRLG